MKNQNHRNKKKLSKIANEINYTELEAELRKNNRRHYKPNRRSNRAGKK